MEDKWYIDELNDNESGDPVVSEYDITSTPNDFNFSTIFSLIDNGVIKMPPFQRNYVWDEKRASKLIESIILGLPVPQVFLYEQGKTAFMLLMGNKDYYQYIYKTTFPY